MRYVGPMRLRLRGDESIAQQYIQFSRKLVGSLQQRALLDKNPSMNMSRRVLLPNGVGILVNKVTEYLFDVVIDAEGYKAPADIEIVGPELTFGGLLWDWAPGTSDLIFASRPSSEADNIFSLDPEGLVGSGVDQIKDYIPDYFDEPVQAGNVDWVGQQGHVITFQGPQSRSLSYNTSAPYSQFIYEKGEMIFEHPRVFDPDYTDNMSFREGHIMGAAYDTSGSEPVLKFMVRTRFAFMLLRVDFDNTLPNDDRDRYNSIILGQVSRTQNGANFSPQTPCFFNARGDQASMIVATVVDGVRVTSEVRVSGNSVQYGTFYKPRAWAVFPTYTVQNGAIITYENPVNERLGRTWQLVSGRRDINKPLNILERSSDVGPAWATVTDKHVLAVDYAGNQRVEYWCQQYVPEINVANYSRDGGYTADDFSSWSEWPYDGPNPDDSVSQNTVAHWSSGGTADGFSERDEHFDVMPQRYSLHVGNTKVDDFEWSEYWKYDGDGSMSLSVSRDPPESGGTWYLRMQGPDSSYWYRSPKAGGSSYQFSEEYSDEWELIITSHRSGVHYLDLRVGLIYHVLLTQKNTRAGNSSVTLSRSGIVQETYGEVINTHDHERTVSFKRNGDVIYSMHMETGTVDASEGGQTIEDWDYLLTPGNYNLGRAIRAWNVNHPPTGSNSDSVTASQFTPLGTDLDSVPTPLGFDALTEFFRQIGGPASGANSNPVPNRYFGDGSSLFSTAPSSYKNTHQGYQPWNWYEIEPMEDTTIVEVNAVCIHDLLTGDNIEFASLGEYDENNDLQPLHTSFNHSRYGDLEPFIFPEGDNFSWNLKVF